MRAAQFMMLNVSVVSLNLVLKAWALLESSSLKLNVLLESTLKDQRAYVHCPNIRPLWKFPFTIILQAYSNEGLLGGVCIACRTICKPFFGLLQLSCLIIEHNLWGNRCMLRDKRNNSGNRNHKQLGSFLMSLLVPSVPALAWVCMCHSHLILACWSAHLASWLVGSENTQLMMRSSVDMVT